MNVAEPEGKSSKVFRDTHNLKENTKYYNSGVTMLDQSTAFNLQDYMLRRMELKERATGKNTDNMMLNEYILENQNIFTEIEAEWNYMPFLPNSIKTENPNFFHFIGISGKYFLDFIKKNSNDLEDTIKNMLKIKNKD